MTFTCSERRELENILWLLNPLKMVAFSLDEMIFQLPEKYHHNTKTWVWRPVLIRNVNRIKLFYENQGCKFVLKFIFIDSFHRLVYTNNFTLFRRRGFATLLTQTSHSEILFTHLAIQTYFFFFFFKHIS